jgi:hypothetical protein
VSHWRALATARDVPETDLRERLTDAYESLYEIVEVTEKHRPGDCYDWIHGLPPCDLALSGVKGVLEDLEEKENECDEAQRDTTEPLLRTQQFEELENELIAVKKERDEALSRLAQVESLIDAYSDLLAMARKFVTLAGNAGVKTRHVRKVGKP